MTTPASAALGTVHHLNDHLDELHDAAHRMHDAAVGRVTDDYGQRPAAGDQEEE